MPADDLTPPGGEGRESTAALSGEAAVTARRVFTRSGYLNDVLIEVADDAPVPAAHGVVSLGRFLAGELPPGVGVRVLPTEDVRTLEGRLTGPNAPAVVVLVLSKFNEGRPYSQARLLREELGYTGPIRAVGDVFRDLLFFLFRCGVSEAILKNMDEEEHAHQALTTFSVLYQPAADEPQPLWRRVAR